MRRLHKLDIILEVFELLHELMLELGQQLQYFRASVYKNETADEIRKQISAMVCLTELLPNEALKEPFRDYEAELTNTLSHVPGECTFSARLTRLLASLAVALSEEIERVRQGGVQAAAHEDIRVERQVYNNRDKILAICRPGSRCWNFFQSL